MRTFLAVFFSFLTLSLPLASTGWAASTPTELENVGIDEHLGSGLDLDLTFQDETGQTVPLKKYIDGTKPTILTFVYFDCPNLCTMVLNAVTDSVKKLNWTSGKEFQILAVSFDPRDTWQSAAKKKEAYLNLYGKPEGNPGWHFLVGQPPQIAALTKQAGFRYQWDKEQGQFAHTSAMMVLTPEGKLSRYFYGIDYPPMNVRVALLEASHGKIGTIVDKFLMFCYHYDTSAKKYVVLASRLMTAGGAVTVGILAFFFIAMWMRERQVASLRGG